MTRQNKSIRRPRHAGSRRAHFKQVAVGRHDGAGHRNLRRVEVEENRGVIRLATAEVGQIRADPHAAEL